jgi:hypothetical protein
MEKMAKSIIIIGIMGLMGYMSISRNEPVVGEKAIKNKVNKDTLHKDIKDTLKKLK